MADYAATAAGPERKVCGEGAFSVRDRTAAQPRERLWARMAERGAACNRLHQVAGLANRSVANPCRLRGVCGLVIERFLRDKTWDAKADLTCKSLLYWYLQVSAGGERGIRTLGRVSPTHAFQACAFNHSAISPL